MALSALIPFAVAIGQSLLDSGGSTAQPGTLGEPTAGQVLAMLGRATLAERTQLSQLWDATAGHGPLFTDRDMRVLSESPASYAFTAWGGSDGQVTSTAGKRHKAYLQELLAKYSASSTSTNPAFIPEQYIPELPASSIGGGINVTGHIGSDGQWTVDLGGAAGDPGYVRAAAPGAWLMPLMLVAAAVALVFILRK
jgi:hypothetical protein